MSFKEQLPAIFGFLLFVVIGYFYADSLSQDRKTNQRVADVGVAELFKKFEKKQPPYEAVSFQTETLDGVGVDFPGRSEKYTVLNIWATWCAPCVEELPSLGRLDEHLGGAWRVMAVSIDTPDRSHIVRQFVEKHGVAHVAAYHDKQFKMQEVLPVARLPTTFILNSKGQILFEIQGEAEWDDARIVRFLNSVLAD